MVGTRGASSFSGLTLIASFIMSLAASGAAESPASDSPRPLTSVPSDGSPAVQRAMVFDGAELPTLRTPIEELRKPRWFGCGVEDEQSIACRKMRAGTKTIIAVALNDLIVAYALRDSARGSWTKALRSWRPTAESSCVWSEATLSWLCNPRWGAFTVRECKYGVVLIQVERANAAERALLAGACITE